MKLTINGREVSCPGGVTYLSLLKELGLEKGALGVSHRGATLSLNAQACRTRKVGASTNALCNFCCWRRPAGSWARKPGCASSIPWGTASTPMCPTRP